VTAVSGHRPLDGKVALVTGAASGIGRSVVEACVEAGASVVAFDTSGDRLRELARVLGDSVRTVRGDARSSADNERAARRCASDFGRLDVFVGNAGVFDGNLTLPKLTPARLSAGFREVFDVNVKGYLLGARACLTALERTRGCMIFTVSNAGFHAGAGGGVLYTTSKHAVVGLVRELAFELAPHIRVNGVAPGGTITDLRVAPSLVADPGKERHFADTAASARGIRATNPLRVLPTPEDHAPLYVLLASDQARLLTGTIIESDGGLAVRGLAPVGRRS
jgi:NAD(P)-dependent dehydrogenase (short-subunit alcohol dehydrogenase family)